MERKVWKECKKTRTEDRKKTVFLPALELLMYDNATWCFFYSAGKNWWLRRDFLQNTNTFFTSADVSKCVRAWKLKEHFESTHWRSQPPNKPLSGSSKSSSLRHISRPWRSLMVWALVCVDTCEYADTHVHMFMCVLQGRVAPGQEPRAWLNEGSRPRPRPRPSAVTGWRDNPAYISHRCGLWLEKTTLRHMAVLLSLSLRTRW